mgnify:CR=1 FL=1
MVSPRTRNLPLGSFSIPWGFRLDPLSLQLRAVADADDLELALVSLRHADDHVLEVGPPQSMQRPVELLVGRAIYLHDLSCNLYADRRVQTGVLELLVSGTLDGERVPVRVTVLPDDVVVLPDTGS